MCGTAKTPPSKAFQIVAPEALASVWPSIRADVAQIVEHTLDGWIAEQVFTALSLNRASLHLGYVGHKLIGWVIVRVVDEYDGRRLDLWLMHSSDKSADPLMIFGDQLNALAKQVNAKRITFSTNRESRMRTGEQLGFVPREVAYQKRVV